jgi:hypothetical protein
MIGDLVNYCIDNTLRRPRTLVIFDNWLSGGLAGLNDLEGGESCNSESTAECFVRFLVTIDCCYFGKASKFLSGLLVRRLEVLAVATPWSIEFDDLEG